MRLLKPSLVLLLAGVATGLAAGCAATDQSKNIEQIESVDFGLNWEHFDAWRSHLVAGEEAWLDIPWHASYREGLLAASKANRPVLLWVMNGHPLGPT
ncbi:MAG: hypothetical protein ACI8TQ_003318 [Planctomycetota bacterium]|jgi:hypothetical protein